jgi:TonB family protein
MGTTSGTISEADGSFTIGNIPEGSALAVTYVGYKSTVIKPVFTSAMKIPMDLDTINSERFTDPMAPPPPPPPPPSSGVSNKVEVPTPGNTVTSANPKKVEGFFMVVEELPQFPGGNAAMNSWIIENMKYPGEAVKKKIEGKVYVTFIITSTGKIKNVDVQQPVNPLLDAEAKRIIAAMPDWKPGTQSGKAVDVRYKVPVEFKLK